MTALDDGLKVLGAVAALIGGPTTVVLLGRTLWQRWTSREERRAQRARTVEALEADKSRALEYASRLRRQLLAANIEPEEWPSQLGRAPRNRPPKKESP